MTTFWFHVHVILIITACFQKKLSGNKYFIIIYVKIDKGLLQKYTKMHQLIAKEIRSFPTLGIDTFIISDYGS